jgi:hypothetical protein
MAKQSITRGNASQFFVAGELCRRGYAAVVTLGNTPNTDILCSNLEGTKFVHIQVKTYKPGIKTCSVGKKTEHHYGDNFFWVLGGIPEPGNEMDFEYYIIPSEEMSKNISRIHQEWLDTPGVKGQKHKDNNIRVVPLPRNGIPSDKWDIREYLNHWDLIEEKLI